jgi:hypothetical protein
MAGLLNQFLRKSAGDAELSYAMHGKFYISGSGWGLLSVPNSLVRGVFDAMSESGLELPPSGPNGDKLNAHISVMSKTDIDKIGGPDKINERGHDFSYTLGPLRTVNPGGWDDMSRVWFVEVRSPELEALRKGYGLSGKPNDGKYEFHISVAVRRKHVGYENDVSKAASPVLQTPPPKRQSTFERLYAAHQANQINNYSEKTRILRELMDENPSEWIVDDPTGHAWGITHAPTNFRFHLPPVAIPDLVKSQVKLKTASIPGITDREDYGDLEDITPGKVMTLVSQLHDARRAGQHHDLRLGDKDIGLLSWASRKGLPEPGGKHLAIRQPLHDWDYKDFEGDIEHGYGAGHVSKEWERPITITSISPDKISFSTVDKKHPERYHLIKTNQGWLITNNTPTEPIPYDKVKYTKVPPGEVENILNNFQDGTSFQTKIDGASSLVKLLKNNIELASYRSSRQTGYPIMHSERVFGGKKPDVSIPKEFEGSVLKGELYGTKGDKAIHPSELGSILNSGVGESLRKQEEKGIKLHDALYDVQQLGKEPVDVNETPYAERRKILEQILPHLPQDIFHLTPEATNADDARKMWESIRSGENPLSSEGVVIHPPYGKPIKSKFTNDSDVYVRGIFPGEGKYTGNAAGGFEYSLEPEGPIVGRVGTGLSDQVRQTMMKNPTDWVGRVAKIRSQEQLPSGAYRAPAFISLHEDITGVPAEELPGSPIKASAEMPIYQRAFNAQMMHPSWSPDHDLVANLASNLTQYHQRGQRMMQDEFTADGMRQQMDPNYGWDRFRGMLNGQIQPGQQNQLDQALFT